MNLALDFKGPAYSPVRDRARLTGQHERVRGFMSCGRWATISEISAATGDPGPSVSAQLRFLRRVEFGGFIVERRARGDRSRGLYEYRVLPGPVSTPTPKQKRAHDRIRELTAEVAALKAELLALRAGR